MIPHTFTIETEEARVINFYAPAGAEIHVMCMARAADERRRPTMEESMLPKCDELNQILSRIYGSVAVTALPFSVPPSEQLLVTTPGVWQVGAVKVARAEGAAAFDAFGLHWRLLAAGNDTNETYDLFEVAADAGAGMPARILGGDEAVYVLAGAVAIESDGQSMGGGVGSFSYLSAGALVSWKATSDARLLIFHFPGGFDRALAGGRGDDALVVAWLESMGTRFLRSLPLAPAVLDAPGRGQ
jgi:quercetin dioxygenase-like cupin family protein